MSISVAMGLSTLDRRMLATLQRIVPEPEREEWLRVWQAELWHAHKRRHASGLTLGLLRDAVWLRGDSLRRAYSGGASLCLAILLGFCVVAAALALLVTGSWKAFDHQLGARLIGFAIQTPLIVLVGFATSPRRHTEQGASTRKALWFRRQSFFTAKMALVIVLAFLLSFDLCQPMYVAHPMTSGLVRVLLFVLQALVGLRWCFHDQQQRCKQCLRSLTTPARAGRPSHSLLEWSGTELACRDGHGLLSVPAMETSWCESSRWSYQ